MVIAIVLYYPFSGVALGYDNHNGLFDSTITSNKENYMIFEDIIATFNFSSHITSEDYFCFGIAENISFNPIFQSEPVQGNFSVSYNHTFSLISQNFSFPQNTIILYLLLYYYNGLFGDEICCYKSITIHKATLTCETYFNFTELEPDTCSILKFAFYAIENASFKLVETPVLCQIYFDEKIHAEFPLFTNCSGCIQIIFQPNFDAQQCEIHLRSSPSNWFTSIELSFRFTVKDSKPNSNSNLLIVIVGLILGISIAGGILFGIRLYNIKIKRVYKLEELKI